MISLFWRLFATTSYPYKLIFVFQKKGIDGYFYQDQLARLKFRVFHMLLEICEYVHGSTPVPVGRGAPWLGENMLPPPGTHQCCSMEIPCLFWAEIEHGRETLVGAINRRPVYNTCFCFSCQQFRPTTIFC